MGDDLLVDGAVNFRDFGGIRVMDGRQIQPRKLFRSGTLHALSDEGLRSLGALGIAAIYDLRSDAERTGRPPRLPSDGSIAHLFHSHERRTGDLYHSLRAAGANGASGRDLMMRVYRRLPYDFIVPYRALFRRLLDGPLPVVFNCAAGKDRTGLAAALILSALGTSQAEIERDYLRTETAFEAILNMFVTGPRGPLVADIDPAIWRPILRADPSYLEAAFEAIAARSGSVAAYLHDDLELADDDLSRLAARLLA